eukprot:Nk52_evm42s1569 gene=Nk52_evmTU42s1569
MLEKGISNSSPHSSPAYQQLHHYSKRNSSVFSSGSNSSYPNLSKRTGSGNNVNDNNSSWKDCLQTTMRYCCMRTLVGRALMLLVLLGMFTYLLILGSSKSGARTFSSVSVEQFGDLANAHDHFDPNGSTGGSQTVNEGADGVKKESGKHEVKGDIHIALNGDASYSVGMFGVINSTYVTCSRKKDLLFHVITSDESSYKLLGVLLAEKFPGLRFKLKIFDSSYLGDTKPVVWKAYRSASLAKPIVYARFFFPRMFPDVKRMLYMDNDILVKKDIVPLWDIDMKGYPIAANRLCRETALFKWQFHFDSGKLDAFDKEECNFNNGVLLYNMDAWKGKPYEEQLLYWTGLNGHTKLWGLGSQPPFNLVFYRNYLRLEDKFNMMDLSGLVEGKYKRPMTRTKAEVENAHVLHWNGVYKPWNGEGPYGELWRHFNPESARLNALERKYVEKEFLITGSDIDPSKDKFTAVISSGYRVDNLKKIIDSLKGIVNCKTIVVVWNNPNSPCPGLTNGDDTITCLAQKDSNTQNRFLIWEYVKTSSVLHYDDSGFLSPKDIDVGFRTWQLHRDVPVGFEPQVIRCLEEKFEKKLCTFTQIIGQKRYSMVNGDHFFIHRDYMKVYASRSQFVNHSKEFACEDIGINFIAGAVSKRPVLWVKPQKETRLMKSQYQDAHDKARPQTVPAQGTPEWLKMRKKCTLYYLNVFKANPMVEQEYYVNGYNTDENSLWFRSLDLLMKWRKEPYSICLLENGPGSCPHKR